MAGKSVLRVVLWFVLAIAACLGGAVGFILYADRAADRDAREFCGAISIGSNIASATAKATENKISWGPGQEYDFYFFHFFAFDKAVCEVSVSKAGKVVAKTVEVEID